MDDGHAGTAHEARARLRALGGGRRGEAEAERAGGVCGAVGCGGIMKNSRHRSRPSASIRGDGT